MAINLYIVIMNSIVIAQTDAVTVGFHGEYYGNTTVHCDDKIFGMPYITFGKYWIIPNGTMLEWDHKSDDKYTVGVWPTFNLTIASLGDNDFGDYYCVVQWDNPRYVIYSIRIRLMPDYDSLLWAYGQRAVFGGLASGVVIVIVTVTCLAYWCKYSEHNTVNEDKTAFLNNEDEQIKDKSMVAVGMKELNTEIDVVSNLQVINHASNADEDGTISVENICNTISGESLIEPIFSIEIASQDSELKVSTNNSDPDNASGTIPFAKVMNHKCEFLTNDESDSEDSVGRQAVYDLEQAANASASMDDGTTKACARELAIEVGNLQTIQKRFIVTNKSNDDYVGTYTVHIQLYRRIMDHEENEPPLPPPPPHLSDDEETIHANIDGVILPFTTSTDKVNIEPIERSNADSDDQMELTFAGKVALFEREIRNKDVTASDHDGIANVIEFINNAFDLDDENYSVQTSGEEIEVDDSDNVIYMDDDSIKHYADLRF